MIREIMAHKSESKLIFDPFLFLLRTQNLELLFPQNTRSISQEKAHTGKKTIKDKKQYEKRQVRKKKQKKNIEKEQKQTCTCKMIDISIDTLVSCVQYKILQYMV